MRGAIIIQKMYIGLETSRCNSLMMTAQRIFVTDFFFWHVIFVLRVR